MGDTPLTVEQLLDLLKKLNNETKPTETKSNNQSIALSEKLTHNNYAKWAKLMYISIGGRGELSHITAPPSPEDSTEYGKWAQTDYIVTSWILENIDQDLVNQFLDYPTAKPFGRVSSQYLEVVKMACKILTLRSGQHYKTGKGLYWGILW